MITNVTSTAATGTSAADAAMKQAAGLNKDDFLKLFITQMQNQDPLNPQDSTQFITQLAQLTQVEQAYNANTNLQNLLSQGTNSTTIAAISLIGKTVQAEGTQVNLSAGNPAPVNFSLDRAASQVTVSILDATGKLVKAINPGAMGSGKAAVSWDGTTDAGTTAPPGTYTFSVSARDANDNNVSATPLVVGKVDSVDMTGAIPTLTIGGITLSLTDVTTVSGGV